MPDKISIIIPVYNVAKYLGEALDSVINQTYTNWEAICVNDGSTDNSLEILNEYANKDSRFIIINQENRGVSNARNTALEKVTGKYIMFLDSDDFFKKEALETALKTIQSQNVDICVFGYEQLVNNELIKSYRSKLIEKTIGENLAPDFTVYLFLWSKIYRTDFIKKYNLRFEEDQHTAEDVIFMYETIFNGATHGLLNKQLYVYRTNRKNSLTTANIKGIKSDIKAAEKLCAKKLYESQTLAMKKNIADRWLNGCLYYYNKFHSLHEHLIIYLDILKMLKFWEKKIDRNILNELENYRELKSLHKRILKDSLPSKKYSENLEEYLKEVKFEKYLRKLKRKLKNKKVLIYGTGSLFQLILQKYSLKDINILGISDGKYLLKDAGNKDLGFNIIPKEKIKDYSPDYILVATKNYEKIIRNFEFNFTQNKKIKVIPFVKK